MANIVHVMGPTCAGKSTIIGLMASVDTSNVGTVEVGKMLREKYGADYFKGQAAPEHTQAEAWSMYLSGVSAHLAAGKKLILVDGQPRELSQVKEALRPDLWEDHVVEFLLIHASHEVRTKRAMEGREGASLDLALKRLDNDYKNCYVVMVELLKDRKRILVLDTSDYTHGELETLSRLFVQGRIRGWSCPLR